MPSTQTDDQQDLEVGRSNLSPTSQHSGRVTLALILLIVFAAGLALRIWVWPLSNADFRDSLLPWFGSIRSIGLVSTVAAGEYNYMPSYIYLLGLANIVLPATTPAILVIKIVSVSFDIAASFVIYHLVAAAGGSDRSKLLAACAVWLAPTVILNSAVWGQCDVIYTTFLLLTLLWTLQRRSALAMAAFGCALAFKLQAAWLGPFVIVAVLRGWLNWRHIPILLAIFIGWLLPAWVMGRPLAELLGVYLGQAQSQAVDASLARSVPNLYAFAARKYSPTIAVAGVAVAATASLAFAFAAGFSKARFSGREALLLATFSVTLVPHLLPFMHERYFYPSDVISIALACVWPAFWLVPILFQLISAVAYLPFLFGNLFPDLALSIQIGPVGVKSWAQLLTLLLLLAAVTNWLLLGYLLIRVKRICSPPLKHAVII